MDIYLVRVSERADNTLWIERKPNATTDDSYIAISHVWGDPDTIEPTLIDGIGTVPLSPGKKDILSILQREDICGSSWFWMDLFCIDQSPNAAISIADQLVAIPAIYKSSQYVKVLIEAPVCTSWQATASRVALLNNEVDADLFKEEELRHSRRCPNMLFHDPWFVRLWTRQEGLYAMTLHVVLLRPVACARLTTIASEKQRWVAEGDSLRMRGAVEGFVDDKLGYHGLLSGDRELGFQFYCDLVYRHRLEIGQYQGGVGPHVGYSPVTEAWRSGRTTTKARDYVLAVFPDVKGYRPPPNARHMTFRALIEDAFKQVGAFRPPLRVFAKLPRGMMSVAIGVSSDSSNDSAHPWILEDPENITEAFDSFRVAESDADADNRDEKQLLVAHPIAFEPLHLSRDSLSDLVRLWETTADTISHAVVAAPSGPCTGVSRAVHSKDGLLNQYFAHQFMSSAVARYTSESEAKAQAMTPAGIVDLDRLDVDRDTFSAQLAQFLVCLMCGTTTRTAQMVLRDSKVEARLVGTSYGRLVALVNKCALAAAEQENFVLVTTAKSSAYGGLQIALKIPEQAGYFVVGRTFIPTRRFWDAILEGISVS